MEGRLSLTYKAPARPQPKTVRVPLRYRIVLNDALPPESQYASLVYELAHLNVGIWVRPTRPGGRTTRLDVRTCEFEAESVAYLIRAQRGIDNPSAQYLAYYCKENEAVPVISINTVMKVAGIIEQMGR